MAADRAAVAAAERDVRVYFDVVAGGGQAAGDGEHFDLLVDRDLHGRANVEAMVPTFIGVTEGALDRGNRVEILQNGAFFDRLLDDIARAKSTIHIESYIWWTGEICVRLAATCSLPASASSSTRRPFCTRRSSSSTASGRASAPRT